MPARPPRATLLRLEPLEGRYAPAVFTWSGAAATSAATSVFSTRGNWRENAAPPTDGTADLVFPRLASTVPTSSFKYQPNNNLTRAGGTVQFKSVTVADPNGTRYSLGLTTTTSPRVTVSGPIESPLFFPVGSNTVNRSGITLRLPTNTTLFANGGMKTPDGRRVTVIGQGQLTVARVTSTSGVGDVNVQGGGKTRTGGTVATPSQIANGSVSNGTLTLTSQNQANAGGQGGARFTVGGGTGGGTAGLVAVIAPTQATLNFTISDPLQPDTRVTVGSGGKLEVGADQIVTIGRLVGTGGVVSVATRGQLRVGGGVDTNGTAPGGGVFNGTLQGDGRFVVAGSDPFTLAGTVTLTRPDGLLVDDVPLSLLADTPASLVPVVMQGPNNRAELRVGGVITLGGVSGNGTVSVTEGSILQFAGSAASVFDGLIQLDGTDGLVRRGGSGSTTISTAATVNVPVEVTGGTLAVDGQVNAARVTGGTLSGIGSVNDLTASGGVIAPGATAGPGTLGTVTAGLGAGSALRIRIFADGSNDVLRVLSVSPFQNTPLLGGTLRLEVDPQLSVTAGTKFTILDNVLGGATDSEFDALPEGAIVPSTHPALAFRIGYNRTAGNDVTLTAVARPTTTVTPADGQPAVVTSSTVRFDVVFSEPIRASQFTAADLVLSAPGASPTVSIVGTDPQADPDAGTARQFRVTLSNLLGEGVVSPGVRDAAATTLSGVPTRTGAAARVTFDNLGPGFTFTTSAANPTRSSSFPVTLTASETLSKAFSFDDIKGRTSNATVSNFTMVSGTRYTFTLTPIAAGTVSLGLPAGLRADGFGNLSRAASFSRVFDPIRPTVTLTSDAGSSVRVNTRITFTARFSEPVRNFTRDDVRISGVTVALGRAYDFQQVSDRVFTFMVRPLSTGTLTVRLANNAAQDLAGNQSVARELRITVTSSSGSLLRAAPPPDDAPRTADASPVAVGQRFDDDTQPLDGRPIVVTRADGDAAEPVLYRPPAGHPWEAFVPFPEADGVFVG